MGLDTTHGCWHGAYSAFNRWRQELAKLAGLPPLDLMEGFYNPITGLPTLYHINGKTIECHQLKRLDAQLPIKWDCLKPDALHELLNHSDCDGEIPWERCEAIADSLERLIPMMTGECGGHIGNWKDKTQAFVDGLRLAAKQHENVEFH